MKRMIITILCLVLLLPCFASAENDYSYIKNASNLFNIDINNDGNAFISTKQGGYLLTFDHQYSLEDHPSYIYSDIIVIDYYGDAIPAWRIWIEYNARRSLGITGFSISLPNLNDEGKIISNSYTKYTFSNIGGKEQITNYSDYTNEAPCIIMGGNNFEFWYHLISLLESFDDYESMYSCVMPSVLHGALEDISFDITGSINAELWLIGEAAVRLNFNELFDNDGTEMTSETISNGKS